MEQQLTLLGVLKREAQPISDEIVRMQPDFLSAIKLAIQVSGLEHKQIYGDLGIDKATWSKILDGQLNFPTNKYELLMDLIGNEIPLVWLAHKRGYGLVPRRDAKDRKIAELEAKNSQLEREIETLVKYNVIQRPK